MAELIPMSEISELKPATEVKEVADEEYRWNILYNWVVQDEEGKYWSFSRLMDKGEMGEHEDFDPSCIQEVEPYERTIIDY